MISATVLTKIAGDSAVCPALSPCSKPPEVSREGRRTPLSCRARKSGKCVRDLAGLPPNPAPYESGVVQRARPEDDQGRSLTVYEPTLIVGLPLSPQCGTQGESGVGTRGPVRKKAPHWNSSAETALFQC
ncbi:hypothetical protein Bbelb_311470 [Branchiostoma belcheri]|nr:hypothetical protein Bbelb_311470 [Branchiostoma belcheri]